MNELYLLRIQKINLATDVNGTTLRLGLYERVVFIENSEN